MKIYYNNTFNCYESTEADINKFGKRIELDGMELTPVIKAKWLNVDEYTNWIDATFKCSKCDREIIIPYANIKALYEDYPYCHCGAKMEDE